MQVGIGRILGKYASVSKYYDLEAIESSDKKVTGLNITRKKTREIRVIAWEVLSCYYKNAVSKEGAVPAAICSIQTFGDMLGFNPHLHILCADGGFNDNGTFYAAATGLDGPILEPLFAHKILSMLKRRGLIGDRVIELICSWRHLRF